MVDCILRYLQINNPFNQSGNNVAFNENLNGSSVNYCRVNSGVKTARINSLKNHPFLKHLINKTVSGILPEAQQKRIPKEPFQVVDALTGKTMTTRIIV